MTNLSHPNIIQMLGSFTDVDFNSKRTFTVKSAEKKNSDSKVVVHSYSPIKKGRALRSTNTKL